MNNDENLEENRKLARHYNEKNKDKHICEPIFSPFERQYAPEIKKSNEMINISDEGKLYGLKTNEILEFAADGKITICHPIKKSESLLWIISKDLLKINDPNIRPSAEEALRVCITANNEDRIFRDLKNTEWLILSKNDCKRLLNTTRHTQSIFEEGWRLNDDMTYESTYPSIPTNTDPFIPLSFRTDRFTYILLKKRISDMGLGNHQYRPSEEYELELDINKLLVSKEELIELLKNIDPDTHIKIIGNEITKSIRKLKSNQNISKKLLALLKTCDECLKEFDIKQKSNSEQKCIDEVNIEKVIKKNCSLFSKNQCEAAARIIRKGKNIDDRYNTDSGHIITEMLYGLLVASDKFWGNCSLNNKDTYPDTKEIQKYLVSNYSFSKSDAEIVASIIRPDNASKGRKPST